ncbi:Dipeptidyl peptidase 4 [Vanrija albida]|uniref:Dipeptidyl peptidase 4 n=1 Tax=Vanrija albida TaxID=181172 RepID=A0ABR3PYT5_9TREE
MSAQYDALPGDERPSIDHHAEPSASGSSPRAPPPPYRHSTDSVGSGSDIVYRDTLDADPFDEKASAARFSQGERDDDADVDEDGIGFPVEPRRLRPRKKSRKILAVLIFIVIGAAAIGILAASGYSTPSYMVKNGNRHITMDHVFNGTFSPHFKHLAWVKEAADGTYSEIDAATNNIVLGTVGAENKTRILVAADDVTDPATGEKLHWDGWQLSADAKYVLFRANTKKQWRHSFHANYYVHRLSSKKTFALWAPAEVPAVSYVKWSPTGHAIALVHENDLYVVPDAELVQTTPTPIRVTNDGSAVVFNGVPDWVYEEEVFQTDFALWWSPNSEMIAFLRSNETEVKEFKLQYYNPTDDAFAVNPYLKELPMRYPKPGTPNPITAVHTFSLRSYLNKATLAASKQVLHWPGEMEQKDRIIVEVAWVADDGLIVKEIDRAARVGQVVVFTGGKAEGQVVRKLGKEGEEGDDGWIDHGQNALPVKAPIEGYLDIVPKDGYDHIALFMPINATEPIWITSGEWEVTKINGLHEETGTVFYTAANPSIDRHVHSVNLPTTTSLVAYEATSVALTDTSAPGYYDVSFSPKAGYYSLTYRGPNVPWQRVIQIGEGGFDLLLEDNAALNTTISEFHRPIETRTTFAINGNDLNVQETWPPNIDTSGRKKYPLLIEVYGGPYSQKVSNAFRRDWHTFLACEQKYIIVRIDGRGTGFKGRQLRNPIRDNLGHAEVEDQIAAARELIKRKYIDRSRVGIWGWSYGGFMTLKTLEAKSDLFNLGMAVAPVTDWRYYDSVYTERYMNTPEANKEGYDRTAVTNVTNFNGLDLLLAHGTGDDNVHFANTASLVDKLTQEKVRGWRMRIFTDSDHSITTRGGNREVYEWMTDYLKEKWGHGGNVQH